MTNYTCYKTIDGMGIQEIGFKVVEAKEETQKETTKKPVEVQVYDLMVGDIVDYGRNGDFLPMRVIELGAGDVKIQKLTATNKYARISLSKYTEHHDDLRARINLVSKDDADMWLKDFNEKSAKSMLDYARMSK